MAQQASVAGKPPSELYLLDPTDREYLLMDAHPEGEMATLFVLTLIADFNGGKALDLAGVNLEFDPVGKSLEIQLQKAAELGLLPASADVAAHVRSFEVFKRNVRAAKTYRVEKYSGKTTLVLPEERDPRMWLPFLPASVNEVRISGNHFTMIRGSNAARIAGLMEHSAGPVKS
jgi:thioesterase domain-containing protein